MNSSKLVFEGKSFCFTGKLAELKRTQAEREVRARGGMSVDLVNERLDYLVIGSIPSAGWKHGSYGTKIEKAQELAAATGSKLQLIPETVFMDGLAEHGETNSGEIDTKVVVVKYKFAADDFDHAAFEDFLSVLQDSQKCHVTVTVEDLAVYRHLFKQMGVDESQQCRYMIDCRMINYRSFCKFGKGSSSGLVAFQ